MPSHPDIDRKRAVAIPLMRLWDSATNRGTMDRIESHLSTASAEYRANRAAMEAGVAKLRATIDRIREGGPESARKRHTERGKLLVRDRVKTLVDPETPFLELS